MKGDPIPDQHPIARLCNPTHTEDGFILASVFMLRASEENLSVNWLEFLNCTSRGAKIAELRNVYSTKFKTIGARAQIAVMNVGEVREKVVKESPDRRNLNVLHNPEPNDPSHSGIYNLKHDDEMIAELIRESILEGYSARE